MITAEELKLLAPLINGSRLYEGFDREMWLSWNGSLDNYQFNLSVDDEYPAECFDLLDRMEAKGFYPSLDRMLEGYECSCDSDERLHWAHGNTRTEAVVHLFLAVMK